MSLAARRARGGGTRAKSTDPRAGLTRFCSTGRHRLGEATVTSPARVSHLRLGDTPLRHERRRGIDDVAETRTRPRPRAGPRAASSSRYESALRGHRARGVRELVVPPDAPASGTPPGRAPTTSPGTSPRLRRASPRSPASARSRPARRVLPPRTRPSSPARRACPHRAASRVPRRASAAPPPRSPFASSAPSTAPREPPTRTRRSPRTGPRASAPRGARRRVRVSHRDPPVRLLRRRGRRRRVVAGRPPTTSPPDTAPASRSRPRVHPRHPARRRDRPRRAHSEELPARAAKRGGRTVVAGVPALASVANGPRRGHSWRGDEASVRRADGVSKRSTCARGNVQRTGTKARGGGRRGREP